MIFFQFIDSKRYCDNIFCDNSILKYDNELFFQDAATWNYHPCLEKHKKKEHQKHFNPIVVYDKGRKRYFSWHSRDPIHLIENEGQDQQLLDFLVPLRDAIYEHSDMKPQFSFPQVLKGEVVYEISSDFRSKWRLLGGMGNGPGDQVLVLLSRPRG